MKRVFAFISLFAIALVMFGFGTSNVKAAEEPAAGKWFENPYLLTDDEGNVVEIPMYIMNSITTTFPDYFDYEGAKGTEFEDKNWGGSVRQYAWNGVKVVIPQFNAEGATGKYYGVYPQGASKGGQIGIGGMIYTTTGTYDQGTLYKGGSYVRTSPADPSLSFYLFNDQDSDWSMVAIEKDNAANPYIIFDAEGKAVAGLVLPDTSANAVEAAYGLGQEFCWDENGVGVVANADASNCARVLVDGEEDDLNKPILDEEGNPTGEYEKVQVPGEDPDYITYRYVWQYMEEKPANLNNGYLNDGWKADNWDFYDEETKVAVTILASSFANGGAVSAAELAADESIDAGHIRAPFHETVIPAGGLLYKLGYLERTSTLLPLYKEVQAQAYLYGRDEAYKQYIKCYNYASSDISFQETALDGLGYSLIEGTNTIEAVAGISIDFDKLINITGISYSFADESDPTSFQSSVLTAEQLTAKYNEFVEEQKALLRKEVAYATYEEVLDKMTDEINNAKTAKDEAATVLAAAKAAKEALEAAAETEILNLTKPEDQATLNEYKELVRAVENADAAIADKKAEIVKLQTKYEVAQKEYEAATVSYKDTLQYKGYNTSLNDAKEQHDSALAVVSSYIALGLGNYNITTADVVVKAVQDKTYENWAITFANVTIQAAKEAFVAAIGTDDEETKEAALKVAFNIDDESVFGPYYESAVDTYIDALVKLNIANIAMSDYIKKELSKTEDKKTAMDAAKAAWDLAVDELGVPFVDANKNGVEDVNEQGTATGLYLARNNAEADRLGFIADYLSNSKDYNNAVTAYIEALAAYLEADETLGAPTTKDENGKTTPATGLYVDYEAIVAEVEGNITAAAEERAEKVFEEWKENEYADNIALEYTVTVDGKVEVFKSPYKTKAEYLDAFMEAYYNWTISDVAAKTSGVSSEYITKTKALTDTAATLSKNLGKTVTALDLFKHSEAAIKAGNKDYKGLYSTFSGGYIFLQMLQEEEFAETWVAFISFIDNYLTSQGKSWKSSGWGLYEFFKYYAQGNTKTTGGWYPTEDIIDQFPLPTKFEDFELTISEVVNEVTKVKVVVYNPIIEMTSTLELEFAAMGSVYDATPIVEINSDALYVTDASSFNVRSIANAYDRIYSEATGLKGNDISSQINFVCPELDAALASGVISGEFPVKMTVVNAYGRKVVTKSTVVKFVDTGAPVLQARDVTLNYGEDFHFLDGIYFAYDNVEGNLFEADYFAFVAEQDTVNTLKPGEYTVKVSAMDKSGNSRTVEYVVVVNEQEVVADDILDAIEQVGSAVEDTQASVDDVKGDTTDIKDNQAGIADDAADAKEAAENNSLVVVATVLAGVAAIASVGAVVLVVLKRK